MEAGDFASTEIDEEPRISYWNEHLASRPDALVNAIRARRGGELLNLDKILLWSEPMSAAWNSFMGSMRGTLSISGQFQELAICSVAIFTGAAYEYHFHAPKYVSMGGSPELLYTLQHASEKRVFDWDEAVTIGGAERAIIQYAEQLTRAARVDDQVFADLSVHFNETQLVELTVLIGAYNMSARLLLAMDVRLESESQ